MVNSISRFLLKISITKKQQTWKKKLKTPLQTAKQKKKKK